MNFLSTVLDPVILLATKVRDVSPQTVHACVKAEAQDSCLKCCGGKYLTYYSHKDVVDLLLCFPKPHAFPFSKVPCVMYVPTACKSGNASCQSNQRSYLSLQVFGGGYFSQSHLILKGTRGV